MNNRPWQRWYSDRVRAFDGSDYPSVVDAWRARVLREPEAVAICYFDRTLTVAEVDSMAEGAAAALQSLGVRRGDRVGVCLQNIPQFVIAMFGLWKLGAAALLLNPMYRGRELRHLIDDAGATGIICADEEVPDMRDTLSGSSVGWILSTSPLDLQGRNDPRVFQTTERAPASPDGDLLELIERFVATPVEPVELAPEDLAMLTYTSGTTGPPKGAMNTHGNVLAVTGSYAAWVDLTPGDAVFAMAPLFHITGAVSNAAIALVNDASLVMTGRFNPEVAIDAFVEHQVTFTIGSITAFNAIDQLERASADNFASFKSIYSGGAPIPPATIQRFRDRFGPYIHNIWGMTETTNGCVAVPLGVDAPVDERTGTLSIGVALPGLDVRIVGPGDNVLPAGEEGELVVRGDQVIGGYWQNPDATAATMPAGWLHTGDGAFMDAEGWIFLADRIKDQINTSGYKVWPREVEDVLYTHPSVHEVAVVGMPDDYRGERVTAFVSLRSGASTSEAELIDLTRQHLAAYKCPRSVTFMPALPKTQTGKIQRNVLRDQHPTRPAD